MKSREQIQRAHDVLHALITERPDLAKTERTLDRALACCSVLCWILDHLHNPRFAQLLATVELEIANAGGVIQRVAVPFVGRRPPHKDG
jgi:hypothetical protein